MNPFPLFDTYKSVRNTPIDAYLDEHPEINNAIASLSVNRACAYSDISYAYQFIQAKSKKSKETFNGYRTEIERFLLWCWAYKNKSFLEITEIEFHEFVNFYLSPPKNWCATSIYPKFVFSDGNLQINHKWKPFKVDKSEVNNRSNVVKRSVEQTSRKRFFAVLIAFYNYLIDKNVLVKNIAKSAKRDTDILIRGSSIEDVKRFSDENWQNVKRILEEKADSDPYFERHLFLFLCMRACYLRISELSDKAILDARMSNFVEGSDGWSLMVFGKGLKLRNPSVPDSLLPYLARYRRYRGLPDLPTMEDPSEALEPIIHKLKGKGSPSARQLDRIFNEGIQVCVDTLIKEEKFKQAKDISMATTHILRHTGASIDSSDTPIPILSEELGHADPATTGRIYVNQDSKRKALYAKNRKI